MAPPSEVVELAANHETAIVLTCPWPERDARSLVERFSWPVFSPPPDTQEDLMRKYGVSAEAAAWGSPDLAWLADGDTGQAHLRAGDGLPAGVEALPGWEHNDVVLWISVSGFGLVTWRFSLRSRSCRLRASRGDQQPCRRLWLEA